MNTVAQQPYRQGDLSASVKRLWCTAFLAAGALYLLTSQRGPAWQDSGLFQWRIRTFDLTGQMGLALAHPLLIVLGRLAAMIPPGPEVWRLNALSGVAAAVAVANVAVLTRRLVPRVRAAAYFSAGAFALAHTVWWLATITESHALLAAIMSGELLALVALIRRPRVSMLLLLGLLNGLGLCAHNLALLALPAYGLVVIYLAAHRKLPWWSVPLFVLAWAGGASMLLVLVVRRAGETGLLAAVHSALFGAQWQSDVLGGSPRAITLGLGYVVYNFPHLALPLAAVGLWRLRRLAGAGLAAVMGYILAVHLLFAIRYTVPDQFMFFVPFYLMVSVLAGMGLGSLRSTGRRWLKTAAVISLVLAPTVYAASPALTGALNIPLPGGHRSFPFRDHARYWLTPWKHNEDSAERFAREVIDQSERQDGPVIVFADGTSYWPIRWVLGAPRKDTKLRLLGGRERDLLEQVRRDPQAFWERARRESLSVFVVSREPRYCPKALLPYVEPRRTGVLYRLRPPARGVPPAGAGGRVGGPRTTTGAARE